MKWIRDRRKELNYSQDDLARALQLAGYDVVRSTVSHWESGRAMPPMGDPGFVRELAKILKLDTMTVLQHAGYSVVSTHSEISERIARMVDQLPNEKRQLALKLVEQLLD